MECAAKNDELDTAKWCREQGAAWPSEFIGMYNCWSWRCVQWALANGCMWAGWRCQDLAPQPYACGSDGAEHSDDHVILFSAEGRLQWSCSSGHMRTGVLVHVVQQQQQQQ
eukprot:2561-Heterococcus_DN1.PRE.1